VFSFAVHGAGRQTRAARVQPITRHYVIDSLPWQPRDARRRACATPGECSKAARATRGRARYSGLKARVDDDDNFVHLFPPSPMETAARAQRYRQPARPPK